VLATAAAEMAADGRGSHARASSAAGHAREALALAAVSDGSAPARPNEAPARPDEAPARPDEAPARPDELAVRA
jgi:hypothetical protein